MQVVLSVQRKQTEERRGLEAVDLLLRWNVRR